ncbi:MAG: WXG100 family type VII secretion target [Caldilineaceae bacterium]
MNSHIVQANYESLERTAQRFAQQAEEQIQLARAVDRALAPLHNGGWIGRGSQAFFAEMHAEVLPALQRLIAALHEAEDVTTQMRQLMQEAEAEAARLFQVAAGAAVAALGGMGAGTDMAAAGEDPASSASGTGAVNMTLLGAPPPRVYIVNGINSLGNRSARDLNGNPIFADNNSAALEVLLEKHGFDPNHVVSTPAIYLMPSGTNLAGTMLVGTHLGGMLSPLDWFTGKAAAEINIITGAGADMVNTASEFLLHNEYVGAPVGSAQTLNEYLSGPSGIETQRTFAFIKNDITSGRNPLLPGQSIVLVAHSGGGAVVTNLAGMIERDLNVDVRGVVTEGSPLASYAEASRYAEYMVEVKHEKDWVHHIGTPVGMLEKAFMAPGASMVTIETSSQVYGGWLKQILNAHGSYMKSDSTAEDLRHIFVPNP